MRRRTRDELEAELARTKELLWRHEVVTCETALGHRPFVARSKERDECGWRWTFKLFRPCGAIGGIVLVVGRGKGQHANSANVWTLDNLADHVRRSVECGVTSRLPWAEPVNKLIAARDAAVAAPNI